MSNRLKKTIENLWFKPYTPIFFLSLILLSIYYFGYPNLQKSFKPSVIINLGPSPTGESDSESASSIVEKVTSLIDLPEDEEPEVVTITDIEKYKDQPFFRKASNGDKLLIYPKTKKAILYDPEGKKILDVGPITDATESARELAEYCSNIATQSGKVAGVASSPSPAASPSPTPTTFPTAEPTPTPTSPSPTEGPTPTP